MFLRKWKYELFDKYTIFDKILIEYSEEKNKCSKNKEKINKKIKNEEIRLRMIKILLILSFIFFIIIINFISFTNIILILTKKITNYKIISEILMIIRLLTFITFLIYVPIYFFIKCFKINSEDNKLSIFENEYWEIFITKLRKMNYGNSEKALNLFCFILLFLEKINIIIIFCLLISVFIYLIEKNDTFNFKKYFFKLFYIIISIYPIIIFKTIFMLKLKYSYLIIFMLIILASSLLNIPKLKKQAMEFYFSGIISFFLIIIYSVIKMRIINLNNTEILYPLIIITNTISVIFLVNNFVINLKKYQEKKDSYRKNKIKKLKIILRNNEISLKSESYEKILLYVKELTKEYNIKIKWEIIIPITFINAVILFKIKGLNFKIISSILWENKNNILNLIEIFLENYKGIVYFLIYTVFIILIIHPMCLAIDFFKESIYQNKYMSKTDMKELEDILKDMILIEK